MDKSTYSVLVRESQARVLKLCVMLLSNVAEAEDAAQEAFVKAYQSFEKFKGDSAFSTWVCRIAYNHCMDVLRKKSRQKTDSLEEVIERAENDPGFAEDNKELAQEALDSLRPEQKEILLMREVGQLSYDQIASELNLSLDAVKSRLRRARHDLQEKARHFFKAGNV